MGPLTVGLAAKAMAILLPYVSKTAEEFVGMAGEAAHQQARKLFERVRDKFSSDAGGKVVLESFEKDPERFSPAVEAILEQSLETDETLAADVAAAVERLGPVLEIVQSMEEGKRVTGLEAGEVSKGSVSVKQDIKKGEDVTGARIDRLG